jgi:starvation-inducible DNA-binding protein
MTQQILNLINKLHYTSSKFHMFHWNVRGKDFLSYHEFFEEAYKELLEQKDSLAEYLRFQGEAVVMDFKTIAESFNGFEVPKDAEAMLEIALKDYTNILQDCEKLEKDQILDAITSDILMQVSKRVYFIKSILN